MIDGQFTCLSIETVRLYEGLVAGEAADLLGANIANEGRSDK